MTKRNENVSNANNSTITNTGTHETGEVLSLKRQLKTEINLKNRAFFFILASDLRHEYGEYCHAHPLDETDFHLACMVKAYSDSLTLKDKQNGK